jgi:hypothetical protein
MILAFYKLVYSKQGKLNSFLFTPTPPNPYPKNTKTNIYVESNSTSLKLEVGG